jgi:hypothetical protein
MVEGGTHDWDGIVAMSTPSPLTRQVDIGEQRRHRLVFGRSVGRDYRRATSVTEPGVVEEFDATRAARRSGRHPTSAARSPVLTG